MKKIFIKIIMVFAFVCSSIYGQYDYGFDFSKAGSSGLQFLKIGVSAREVAMGEAVTGSVKGVNALYWNVAGIAYSTSTEASFSYNNWLVDSKVSSAAAVIPWNDFVIGVNAISFAINDFEETTVANPNGTGRMVSAGDLLIGLSLARRFTDKLSIGMQIKYVREKLDDYSADNVLFDIGALYYTGFRNIRLAFSLQHFGPDMQVVNQTFKTPLLFRLSATDEIIDTEDLKLTLAAELVHPTDNNEWVNVGTELNLMKYFFVRGGYRFNVDESKFSAGIGVISPRFTGIETRIDYAYTKSEIVFDDIHRITIGFKL